MTAFSADDVELLWTHIEAHIDLSSESAAHPLVIHGTIHLWVVPRAKLEWWSEVRVHCRYCLIESVTINGIPSPSWEHIDPHAAIVSDEALVGDGEAFDVYQRAAFMAAHDGELLIKFPCSSTDLPPASAPSLLVCGGSPARLHAARGMIGRLERSPPGPRGALVIAITYRLHGLAGGGLRLLQRGGGDGGPQPFFPLLYTTGGGGGSCLGLDFDGARCRWPCLHGPHHAAPVDFVLAVDAVKLVNDLLFVRHERAKESIFASSLC
jgi:hypothetical protein